MINKYRLLIYTLCLLALWGGLQGSNASPSWGTVPSDEDRCFFPTGIDDDLGTGATGPLLTRYYGGIVGPEQPPLLQNTPFRLLAWERVEGQDYWIISRERLNNDRETPQDEEAITFYPAYVSFADLTRDELAEYSNGKCVPEYMGIPPVTPIPLGDLRDMTGVAGWEQTGAYSDGTPVKVGLIDNAYGDGQALAILDETANIRYVFPSSLEALTNPDFDEKVEDGHDSGEHPELHNQGDHGVMMLQIMAEIAPDAEYYVTSVYRPEDFEEAAYALQEAGVEIIVSALGAIADAELYRDVVRDMTSDDNQDGNPDILWINSAGNIGAGYYADIFVEDRTNLTNFSVQINKTGAYPFTIPVPFDPRIAALEHPSDASITLVWDEEEEVISTNPQTGEPINKRPDLRFQLYPNYLTSNGPYEVTQSIRFETSNKLAYRFVGTPELRNILMQMLDPRVNYAEATHADVISLGVNQRDSMLLAPNEDIFLRGDRDINGVEDSDGLEDNISFFYVTSSPDTTSQSQLIANGTFYEVYIHGAVPQQFNPYATRSLDPVVLAPGDIPESFTIGAYDHTTGNIAWFSSRFNALQYRDSGELNNGVRYVKPDILAYSIISLPVLGQPEQFRNFEGTSPATAIAGGIAAVIASRDGFNPNDIRRRMSTRYATCDGQDTNGEVVSLQIPLLKISDAEVNKPPCAPYDEWRNDVTQEVFNIVINDEPSLNVSIPDFPQPVSGILTINVSATAPGFQSVLAYMIPDHEPDRRIYLSGTAENFDNGDAICNTDFSTESELVLTADTEDQSLFAGDGTYALYVFMCAGGEKVKVDKELNLQILNGVTPTLLFDPGLASVPVSGTYNLLGTALWDQRDFEGRYLIAMDYQEEPEANEQPEWSLVVPAISGGDGRPQRTSDLASLCRAEPDTAQPFGLSPVGDRTNPENTSGILSTFDTARYSDGNHIVQAILCADRELLLAATTTIFIDNEEEPFLDVVDLDKLGEPPYGISTTFYTNREYSIRGRVGGEGFEQFFVEITNAETGEARILYPEYDPPVTVPASTEGYCDLSRVESFNTLESTDKNPIVAFLPNYNFPTGEYLGSYTIRIIACFEYAVKELPRPLSVTIVDQPQVIEKPEIVITRTEPSAQPVAGVVQIYGSVIAQNLQGWILEVGPANATTSTDWIVIRQTGSAEDGLCPSIPTGVSIATLSDSLLSDYDTSSQPDGDYQLRLRACTSSGELPSEPESYSIAVKNRVDMVVELTSPSNDEIVTSNTLAISGTVIGSNIKRYVIETARAGTEVWIPVIPPNPDDDPCDVPVNEGDLFGNPDKENEVLGVVDTDSFLYGESYEIRVRACLKDDSDVLPVDQTEAVVEILSEVPIATLVDIDLPENGTPVSGAVDIIGTVKGTDVAGYAILLQENEQGDWQSVYPVSSPAVTGNLSDAKLKVDFCQVDGLAIDREQKENEVLATIETAALQKPDGNYVFRVMTCVEDDEGNLVTGEASDDVILNLKNGAVVIEFGINQFASGAANNAVEYIEFTGTVSAPSFSHYIIETANIDAYGSGEVTFTRSTLDELNWTPVVASLAVMNAATSTQDNRSSGCETPVESGRLGSYAIANGTLGILAPNDTRYAGGFNLARLRVCFEDGSYEDKLSPIFEVTSTGRDTRTVVILSQEGTEIELREQPGVTNPTLSPALNNGAEVLVDARTEDYEWVRVISLGDIPVSGWLPSSQIRPVFLADVEVVAYSDNETVAPTTEENVIATPDGLLYVSDLTGQWQIYRIDSPNEEPVQLTSQGNNEYPTLSPDGQLIAFASDRDGNNEIYVMNLDGSNQRNLTQNGASDYRPAWSPDGDIILFESTRAGNRDIFSLKVETGEVFQITSDLGDTCCVAWSSNNQQIAFSAFSEGDYDIYIGSVDGSDLRNITISSTGDDVNPAWQPGGNRIAFQTGIVEGQISVVNTDGSGYRQLTESSSNRQPSWYSGQILFSSNREGGYDLYLMNPDGSNQHRFLTEPGSDFSGDDLP